MMGVGAVLDKSVIDFALYVLEILLMKGLVFQIFTLIFMAVVLTSSLVASLYTVSLLRAYAMPAMLVKVAEAPSADPVAESEPAT